MGHQTIYLNRTQLDHLTRLVADHPGRTIDEHLAEAGKVTERQLIAAGLVALVRRCAVHRDEHGRLWPT
ncbi:hypothetical protein [Streptomyces sp. NBC_00588]|uniref:hypothetical protein n=1 Tax=Streptomyces sp. NBC_00588 TaxID=2975784 RepID=UPI002E8224AE|nr:hypothetical protein [Streptomyces sp. NBC_00588]WUB35515.1 hypothetical protein OHN38_11540 [Streptomyces sp. NBC_00588]